MKLKHKIKTLKKLQNNIIGKKITKKNFKLKNKKILCLEKKKKDLAHRFLV